MHYRKKKIKGGKLNVSELKGLLNASYENSVNNIDGFVKDKELSTNTSKVFYNPERNQAVVTHRGTSGISDWFNNAVYGYNSDYYKYTPRYKEAEKVQKNAEKKYGSKNVTTIGHSQGGLQSELLGKNSREIITLNKATKPFSNYRNSNQYDIRAESDVVSRLNPFQNKNDKEIIIPSKSSNPISEHYLDVLNRLDQDREIGQGIISNGRSNGLFGDDIEKILSQHGKKIHGVFSKDKLPKVLKDGWYVVNMQSSNEGNRKGTHWVCLKSIGDGETMEYFDAFGFSPPTQILERVKGNIYYSNKEIQDQYATTCGWFVIGAIISDNDYNLSETHFKKYLNMFSNNTRLNDKILSHYLTKKGIH
jgi:hypothetical protein